MVQIDAFRGIRFDLGHVGSLSDVVAPPYDVIDDGLRDQLYERHAANVIRLILNRSEPGDESSDTRYSRAALFFRQWLQQGVLLTEADPAIYVYHQVFEYEGQQFTRRGFMSRMRLEPLGEGTVFPHEETHAAAKLDRLTLYGPGCPAVLKEAIRHSLLSPGKRLRPMLVLMAARACGQQDNAALSAACAVEMIHTYSLIHDDLPAMDDDDLRRGLPTCHRLFGEANAILAGDALLAQAFEVLASSDAPAGIVARCCRELARAAGAGSQPASRPRTSMTVMGDDAPMPSASLPAPMVARATKRAALP